MLWKLENINIKPDVIFYLFGNQAFPVTNTLLCTWISILVLVIFFYFATRKHAIIPSRFQSSIEWIVEYLLGLVQNVSGKEKGKKFFPLVASLFIFILVCNLLDVIPGVDTVGTIDASAANQVTNCQPFLGFLPNCKPLFGFLLFGDLSNKLIPWIRPATSDLNLTLAMALVTVVTCQVFGFATLGAREHLLKYINLRALFKFSFQGFIEFFVGILDIVSELSRIISFAFRLFGNIFAGSAVLAVFAYLLPGVADVIFIPFELFVAVVQALVFSLLTLIFLEIATTSHNSAHDAESEHEAHEEFAHNEAERLLTPVH